MITIREKISLLVSKGFLAFYNDFLQKIYRKNGVHTLKFE